MAKIHLGLVALLVAFFLNLGRAESLSYQLTPDFIMKLYPTSKAAKFQGKVVGIVSIDLTGKFKAFQIKHKHLVPEVTETMKNSVELSRLVPLESITEKELIRIWGDPTQNFEKSTIPTNNSYFSTFKLIGKDKERNTQGTFLIDIKFHHSKICAYRIRAKILKDSRWLGIK